MGALLMRSYVRHSGWGDMDRRELVVRIVWPVAYGILVCATVLGVGLLVIRTLPENRLISVVIYVGAIQLLVWLLKGFGGRLHPRVFGIDLAAPELSGERFLGVVGVMMLIGAANTIWG